MTDIDKPHPPTPVTVTYPDDHYNDCHHFDYYSEHCDYSTHMCQPQLSPEYFSEDYGPGGPGNGPQHGPDYGGDYAGPPGSYYGPGRGRGFAKGPGKGGVRPPFPPEER